MKNACLVMYKMYENKHGDTRILLVMSCKAVHWIACAFIESELFRALNPEWTATTT